MTNEYFLKKNHYKVIIMAMVAIKAKNHNGLTLACPLDFFAKSTDMNFGPFFSLQVNTVKSF